MAASPDISAFKHLLRPIEVGGPQRFIYSYVDETGRDEVGDFLRELMASEPGRYSAYVSAFKMVAMRGFAAWEKWHMLDKEKVPRGISKDSSGRAYSLDGIGEFKNVAHQSRIYHCTRPQGLIVLLTVFREKKENDLTADAINPALKARERFLHRLQIATTRK